MALMNATYAQSDAAPLTASLGATTSTAELSLGSDTIHTISATGAYHIRVGLTGMGAASASHLYIPAGVVYTFYTGRNTHIRIFNPGGAGINYFVQPMIKC